MLHIDLKFPCTPSHPLSVERVIVFYTFFVISAKSTYSPIFLKILAKCLHCAYTMRNGKHEDIQEGH